MSPIIPACHRLASTVRYEAESEASGGGAPRNSRKREWRLVRPRRRLRPGRADECSARGPGTCHNWRKRLRRATARNATPCRLANDCAFCAANTNATFTCGSHCVQRTCDTGAIGCDPCVARVDPRGATPDLEQAAGLREELTSHFLFQPIASRDARPQHAPALRGVVPLVTSRNGRPDPWRCWNFR